VTPGRPPSLASADPRPPEERRQNQLSSYAYALRSKHFIEEGVTAFQGVAGLQRVPDLFVRDFEVADVPLEEQRRIADFLDDETSRIGVLVAHKRQLISLNEERRATIIDSSVFGSADGKQQQSGIPTVGLVPASWTVYRNKHLYREAEDLSRLGDEELLSVSHLTGVTPRSEKDVNMFLAESLVGYKRVQPGDLVVNTMWAWMGALGVSRHFGVVSPAYGVYRPCNNETLPAYFDLVYRSQPYVSEMTRFSKGVWSSRLRLYPEAFLSLRVPCPPISEQQSIVDAYRRQTRVFDLVRDHLEASAALLEERRIALITAAVTGQLDPTTARGAA